MVNDRQNLDLSAFSPAPDGAAVEWLISDGAIPYPEAVAAMDIRLDTDELRLLDEPYVPRR